MAGLSYAERKKVGAIAVKNGSIIAEAYNGTPPGWDNCCEYNGITKPEVIHAEANLLMKLAKSTISSEGAIIFLTLSPCQQCANLIAAAGIKEVYYKEEYRDLSGVDFLTKYGVLCERIAK